MKISRGSSESNTTSVIYKLSDTNWRKSTVYNEDKSADVLESKDTVVGSLKRVVVVERTGVIVVVVVVERTGVIVVEVVLEGLEVTVVLVVVKEGRVELVSGTSALIYCPSQSLYEETRV